MTALIRLVLMAVALVVAVAIIATHGVRGVVFLILLALVLTLPRTQVWQVSERFLVRVTGSRQRAAMLVMGVIIGAVAVVNVIELVR